jgi:hypothetical protein
MRPLISFLGTGERLGLIRRQKNPAANPGRRIVYGIT